METNAPIEIHTPRANPWESCAPGGMTGFSLPPVEGLSMLPCTWAQLRAVWPEWLAAKRAAAGIRG